MTYRKGLALAIILCLLAVPVLAQGGLTVSVGDIRAPHGQDVTIPIEVRGASGVGAMHIEITYDPAVLAPTGTVQPGQLAAGGLVVGNTSASGRVILSVAHANGFSGDGVVANVVARVSGMDGASTPLRLQNVTAHNAQSKAAVAVSTSDGAFAEGAGKVSAKGGTPAGVWVLVGLLGVLIVGAIAYAFTRRTATRPVAAPKTAGGLGLQVSGVSASQAFLPLDQPVITIGRATTNSLMLDDEQVSREHARIVATGDARTIYDLGSSNGTFVNGQRVAHQVLQPGDRITLGAATLLVRQG
jgi:hypothetical protein